MNVGHRAIFTTELVARSIKNELSTSCRRILSLVHGAALEAIAGTESLEDECFPGMMDRGRVIHDFQGAAKQRLQAEDLLARFEEIRRSNLLDETAAEMLRESYV